MLLLLHPHLLRMLLALPLLLLLRTIALLMRVKLQVQLFLMKSKQLLVQVFPQQHMRHHPMQGPAEAGPLPLQRRLLLLLSCWPVQGAASNVAGQLPSSVLAARQCREQQAPSRVRSSIRSKTSRSKSRSSSNKGSLQRQKSSSSSSGQNAPEAGAQQFRSFLLLLPLLPASPLQPLFLLGGSGVSSRSRGHRWRLRHPRLLLLPWLVVVVQPQPLHLVHHHQQAASRPNHGGAQ